MKYVLIGKLVNTHGLKGEVRILSDFKYKDKIFIPGMKIYIGKNKTCETIKTYRHHKIFQMITMGSYNDINQVLKYKGDYVFVNKEDIKLGENEYLDEDIIGLDVYVENNKYLGKVKEINDHGKNRLLMVTDKKTYLIPYNSDIILSIDIKNNKMDVKNIVGWFD